MQLADAANQVLQEFGGVIPENILSIEDAKREFLSVRALELQKLGISTTDITVKKKMLSAVEREGNVPPSFGQLIPAYAELVPYNGARTIGGYKVEIIPNSLVPSYEGSRAMAFFGTPLRFRLAWNAWQDGELYLWYDPVEDLKQFSGSTDVTFPEAFWMYLFKKTAYNLVRIAQLKLAYLDPAELRERAGAITAALVKVELSLLAQTQEWQAEFRKFMNLDRNQQPHLRRAADELKAVDYDNVTGHVPMDYIG